MASAAAAGVAVKFWTPNLGARVPTDLNTDVPDYREYLESGLWGQRRMLRSVSGTGAVTYEPQPQDARVWPESLPTAVLQVYDSRRPMIGAGQERFCGSEVALEVALHCLEGQLSLIHHVMAFEEANGGRKILSDTQRWKAQFAAYFLGALSQGQLALLERTTNDTAAVAYTSPNSWVIKTSKRLSYELRHNTNRNLGRLNDAQFEHLPMLQGSHPLQRRSLGRELRQGVVPDRPRQGVLLHEDSQLGLHQCRWSSAVSDTWRTVSESTGDTFRVRRGRSRTTSWHGSPVRAGRDLLLA